MRMPNGLHACPMDWHKFDIETLSLGNAFINCPKYLAYNRGSILTMKFDNKSSYFENQHATLVL